MSRRMAIIAALALVGCEQQPSLSAPSNVAPASLQLVPADYYSRLPRARLGQRPGPDSKPKTEKRGEDGAVSAVEPDEPPMPSELSNRLDRLDAQLQWLRRSITRPPARGKLNPSESDPPT
jgi:hypothetical protein